jgi:phosphatidylserine/phosphatidylglycerophosphate/cardiolipin synthase-like enzyme
MRRYFFILSIIVFNLFPTGRGVSCEVYFSRRDNCRRVICDLIDSAERSIDFAYYILTDVEITKSLELAKKRGVKVRGLVDKSLSNNKSSNKLKDNGIIKTLSKKNGIMHHKFMIIDREIVLTGSYNLTYSAYMKNDENFVLIHNDSIAAEYFQEFIRLNK